MKIQLNKQIINNVSLDQLDQLYSGRNTVYQLGEQYHKLYAYISTLFNNIKIADIGTRTGNTAISLSYNTSNIVDSYDIDPKCLEWTSKIVSPRIKFFSENILNTPKILEYNLISLDIDPHSGSNEMALVEYLIDNKWQGTMLMDDIGIECWPDMNAMWNKIQLPKWDITEYGHGSGTGLIDFSNTIELELI